MADQQLGINQGDHIYYYDLSTGGIDREWTFQGGTPSTSTAYGPDIRYYGVNYTGYSTGLVITGAGGITAAAYKPNIIVVYPENFSASIVITGGSGSGYGSIGSPGGVPVSPMSRNLTYTAGGTAGSGYGSYLWTIPQLGLTSGSLLSSVTYACTDWYTLTGSYLGSPNSSYISSVSLYAVSTAGNSANAYRNVNFTKIGVQESINYGSTGTYATSGKYYDVSSLGVRTSSMGLGGNFLVFKVDLDPYSPKWDNTSFHSTQESVYIWPNNPDVSKTYSSIKTNIILSGSALSSAGVTGSYTGSPRIMTGNYIIPGDVSSQFSNRFYISDYLSGGPLTNLVDSLRKWNTAAVSDFIENKYYLSGSSKFIELGGYGNVSSGSGFIRPPFADLASGIGYKSGYLDYLWDGGWGAEDGYAYPVANYHGICVPTSAFIEEVYGTASVNVDVRIILRDSAGSIIADFDFEISSSGNSGNTPDEYMISAKDSSFGNLSGIATLINGGIASEPGNLTNNIIFDQDGNLSPYYDGGAEGIYTLNSYFGGLKMSIKDPRTGSYYSSRYIHSMEVMWGPQMQDFLNEVILDSREFPTVPFASNINSTGSSMASWTGLPSKITVPASSYSNYFRGWKIGGSL